MNAFRHEKNRDRARFLLETKEEEAVAASSPPWLGSSLSFLPLLSLQTDLVLAAPDHGLGELQLVTGHVHGLPRGLLDRGDGDGVHFQGQ